MRNRRFTGFLVVLPSLALVAGTVGVAAISKGESTPSQQLTAAVAPERPNFTVGDTAAEARHIRETIAQITAERRAAAERAAAEAAAAARQAAAEQRAAERRAARQAAAAERARERASRDATARAAAPAPVPAQAAADDIWAKLRNCEAGGRYDRNSGNGYYGAYQFSPATWRSLGYSGLPHEAPPEVQDEAARKLQARSGWGQWPACSRRIGAR